MPAVGSYVRRYGAGIQFLVPTSGDGAPPSVLDPPGTATSTPGTPIGWRQLSRYRPSIGFGPHVQPVNPVIGGSPVFMSRGPLSRYRPRQLVGPSVVAEASSPAVDITSVPGQVLAAQDASVVFADENQAQIDVWDIGGDWLLVAQDAVIPAGSTASQLAVWQVNELDAVLQAENALVLTGAGIVGSSDIGGSGVLVASDAQIISAEATVDNRASGLLQAQDAQIVGVGTVEIPPISSETIAAAVANITQAGGRFTQQQTLDLLLVTQLGNTFGFKPDGKYTQTDTFGFYWWDGATKVIEGRYEEGQRLVLTIQLPQT